MQAISVFFNKSLFFILLTSSYVVVSQQLKVDTLKYESVETELRTFDLLDVPVEDALIKKVSVASKTEQLISEAPNSVSAYSADDIRVMGYYTLKDLSNITSGYSSLPQYGEYGFETRGQFAGAYNNNKHLLLIDGIPVNFARSYKAASQEEIPLFFARRVEFLKGPASALYGVSAFNGVINILSDDPKAIGTKVEGMYTAGSRDFGKRVMIKANVNKLLYSASLSVGWFEKQPLAEDVGYSKQVDYKYWDGNKSFFMNSTFGVNAGIFKGVSFGWISMVRRGGLGEMFWGNVSSEVNSILWDNQTWYVKYKRKILPKMIFNTYVKYNNSLEEGQFQLLNRADSDTIKSYPGLSIYKSKVANVESLAEFNYTVTDRSSIISGFNYDYREELGNPNSYAYLVESPNTKGSSYTYRLTNDFKSKLGGFHTISAFTQYQLRLSVLKGLILTAGLRLDNGINNLYRYSNLSPRVAIVQKISNSVIMKAMSGRALLAPAIKEASLAKQIIYQFNQNGFERTSLPSITAESVQNTEWSLGYYKNKFQLVGTLYYNELYNRISTTTLIETNGKDTIQANWIENIRGITTAKGWEIDFQGILTRSIKVFGNGAYAISRNQEGSYISGVPVYKVNTGVGYTIHQKYKYTFQLVNRYVSAYRMSGTTQVFYRGMFESDVNVVVPLLEQLRVEFQVRNLFNQKNKIPPIGIPVVGRIYNLSVGVIF